MEKTVARVFSAELTGIHARPIEVETDLNVGLHAFNIVGLGDKSLAEARERVNSALKNLGAKPPNRENRKITVNLAPADIKKTGSQYDLAIALGYLAATGQIKGFDSGNKIFVGELALDGRLRPITGALNIAQMAKERGFEELFLPQENANEASVVSEIKVLPVSSLQECVDALEERKEIRAQNYSALKEAEGNAPDLGEIVGQEHGKRCLIIAAAGGHNLLMAGPPGVGKSLLAQALSGILPKLAREEAIEITKIWSAAGINLGGLISSRPMRTPHQTSSLVSLIGGGSHPKPGEISLAHRGILFLDELPEFPRNILEALRAPMESGEVHVARAKESLVFPSKFTLVAAMNPCPCGYYGDAEKECRCAPYEVIKYSKKISGPLLDRIDLQIRVGKVKLADLRNAPDKQESAEARVKIEAAREIQAKRFEGLAIKTNAEMSSKQVRELLKISASGENFLKQLERTDLSPRGYYRLLKTSQTIADLENSSEIKAEHLAEALSYRLREI
jgi:magnesium chelatase family protein